MMRAKRGSSGNGDAGNVGGSFHSPQPTWLRRNGGIGIIRVSTTLVLGVFVCFGVCFGAAAAPSQPAAESTYTEVFYPSGSLRIQAYLYKPAGNGPFPMVIYNHGS